MADATAFLYYAGSCKPDPGIPTIGFIIRQGGEDVYKFSVCLGSFDLSSNAAHYRALIAGLQHALWRNIRKIIALGHCPLVSDQVKGKCGTDSLILRMYRRRVLELRDMFDNFVLWRISRRQNYRARYLARKGFCDPPNPRNTFVRSTEAMQDIVNNCATPNDAIRYVKEHSVDGLRKIEFILETMRRSRFKSSHEAVQRLGCRLMGEINLRHWRRGRPPSPINEWTSAIAIFLGETSEETNRHRAQDMTDKIR